MNYDYFNDYEYSEEVATAVGAGIFVLLMVLLVVLAIGIMMYIFNAVGLYKMAKRLNISGAWLAFIPIGNVYIMGRVAQEPVYGQKKLPYGWILLGLSLFTNIISVTSVATTIGRIIKNIDILEEAEPSIDAVMPIFGAYFAGGLLSSIASIVYIVFYYIALYHVFKNFAPENATLYLVLSILFSFLTPFFVFSVRNKPIGGGYGYNGGYGGYNGYNQGYNTGYGNGYNNGYNPQNNGYNPQNNGYNPQNNGYNPQNNGYNPQSNGYNPGNGYNTPENNNSNPPYNNPPQGQ